MGVYIKGIEKPTSCHDCVFNYHWRNCMAKIGTNDTLWDFTRYSPAMVYASCPLEPIDDKLLEKMQCELINAWRVFKSVIKDEKP